MQGWSGHPHCCPTACRHAENGCGAADHRGADGIVYDRDRIMFMRSFTQLSARAVEIFRLSVMDKFE